MNQRSQKCELEINTMDQWFRFTQIISFRQIIDIYFLSNTNKIIL